MMKYIDAKKKNLKVLAGLQDFFKRMGDHEAFIGRHRDHVVIDLNKVPAFIQDEIGDIHYESALVSPNGRMNIFESFQSDKENGVLLMSINVTMKSRDGSFSQFPVFHEVWDLLASIPVIPEKQGKEFDAMYESMSIDFEKILSENREAIVQGLFGGGEEDSDWNAVRENRTLN